MLNTSLKGLAAAGFLAAALLSQPAYAVSCPGSPATTDREFTISADASCLDYGTGNIGQAQNDPFLADNPTYQNLGELTITSGAGTASGTFTITQALLDSTDNLALGFKSGEGQFDPDWAVFLLSATVAAGVYTFSIDPTIAGGLSHIVIYGNPVPLPGALLLMGTVLAGGVGYRKLRNRRRNAAIA